MTLTAEQAALLDLLREVQRLDAHLGAEIARRQLLEDRVARLEVRCRRMEKQAGAGRPLTADPERAR